MDISGVEIDEDANSATLNPPTNSQERQDLLDTIAQLEQRLQKAQTSINSYQNERSELLGTIIQLKLRLQNVVDILEK